MDSTWTPGATGSWVMGVDPASSRPYWNNGVEPSTFKPPLTKFGILLGRHQVPLPFAPLEVCSNAVGYIKGDEVGNDGLGTAEVLEALRTASPSSLSSWWDRTVGAFWILRDLDWGETCHFGDLELWTRVEPSELLLERPNVVTASAFTFTGAYCRPDKYARGLVHLARMVEERMDGFHLRVFLDDSIFPHLLGHAVRTSRPEKRTGKVASVRTWEWALSELLASPVTVLIRFSHPMAAVSGGGGGHSDLFGVLPRFLPLFSRVDGVAEWAGGPENGRVVYMADADFSDGNTEHACVNIAKDLAAMEGGEKPELVVLSSGASTAPRHFPQSGLPPSMVLALIGTQRLDVSWLADFLEDAARGKARSHVAGRYSRILDDGDRGNDEDVGLFDDRARGPYASPFAFGIDEHFFSAVLVPRAVASDSASRSWVFFVVPPANFMTDRAVLALRHAARSNAPAEALQTLAAAIVSVVREESLTPESLCSRLSAEREFKQLRKQLVAAAAVRQGSAGSPEFKGGPNRILGPHGAALAEDLCVMQQTLVDLASAGAVPMSLFGLDQALQHLHFLSDGAKVGLTSVQPFLIGRRILRAQPIDSPAAKAVIDSLQRPRTAEEDPHTPQPTLPDGIWPPPQNLPAAGVKRPRT